MSASKRYNPVRVVRRVYPKAKAREVADRWEIFDGDRILGSGSTRSVAWKVAAARLH
jgi:hypothetical protein